MKIKTKNKPYVKIYDNGILTNPITKEQPFLNNPHIAFSKFRVRFRQWQLARNKFFKGKNAVNP